MLNNQARKESGRILRLSWVLTGDPFRPLTSRWSLYMPNEMPMIRTPGFSEVCNAAVTEKCETSMTRRHERNQVRSLTMCGK
jgi:hypothetical protein